MDHSGIDRRRLFSWGGLAAAGVVAAGVPLVNAGIGNAASPRHGPIPPDTLPGGAYDRYVAQLAAEGRFSGVVMLSLRGRTVLSRSYGMTDKERGIPQPRRHRVHPQLGGQAVQRDSHPAAAKIPLGPASFGTYGPSAEILGGQRAIQRAGGNPGVGANWSIYPDTGWVGVILSNCDGVPLVEMIGQETQPIKGASSEGGGGG